jgi:hypothetical protein
MHVRHNRQSATHRTAISLAASNSASRKGVPRKFWTNAVQNSMYRRRRRIEQSTAGLAATDRTLLILSASQFALTRT